MRAGRTLGGKKYGGGGSRFEKRVGGLPQMEYFGVVTQFFKMHLPNCADYYV